MNKKQRRRRLVLLMAIADSKRQMTPLFASRKLNMDILRLSDALIKQKTHVHRDIRRGIR